MPIVFPIDVPQTPPSAARVGKRDANRFEPSPYTGRGTVQEFEGEWWTLQLNYSRLRRVLAQPVSAFGSKLRKSVGTFVIAFPGYVNPLGTAKDIAASPSVNGSGQAGNTSINIKSAPANQTGWLVEGDIIQVGPASRPHWHEVLENVDTDGTGLATIEVWPRVREGTIDNDLVATENPLCIFRVIERRDIDFERPVRQSFEFTCREDI